MRIVEPGFEILYPTPDGELVGIGLLKEIERIARVCYKSEDKITDESAPEFVKKLVKRGHYPMLDHVHIRVKVICDRGISHEWVRHRIAAHAQESSRYCNYSKGMGSHISFIKPCFLPYLPTGEFSNPTQAFEKMLSAPPYCSEERGKYDAWLYAMYETEKSYFKMIKNGASPGEARSALPNSLKTEIITTMDVTAWRHFFSLRTAGGAHAQMREITQPMLREFRMLFPIVFDDVGSINEEAPKGA